MPDRSTATQYDVVGHETAVSACPLSISVPPLQDVPFQPKTRPMESTARQYVAVGHETPVRPEASVPLSGGSVAIGVGVVNPSPFHVSTLPLLSTSAQYVVDAHETALSWPCVSASLGWVQLWPLNAVGPPSAATQNVGETQEIWFAAPQAPRLPDQPAPSKAKEFPSPSMVTQKVGPVQSMAVKPAAPDTVVGACQVVPLYIATWFSLGAAAQKLSVAHDR